MYIRKADFNDYDTISNIYSEAREYMKQNGNPNQWGDTYPPDEVIQNDINNGALYVVIDENEEAVGVFAFLDGPDITYKKIYNGKWHNDDPYKVIHRVAVKLHRKGVASFVFDYCINQFPVIRIDTHRDNIPMQKSLKKNGFSYCGIIYLQNGAERLAFQKERS